MPVVTVPLGTEGAIISVFINHSIPRQFVLRANKQPVPSPFMGRGSH